MNNSLTVTPSSQVHSTVPRFIYENYDRFVEFMETAAESEERLGFGQDILQQLLKYRDFDTYRNEIVQFNYLANPYNEIDESREDEERVIATSANVAILGQSSPNVNDTLYILAETESRILKLNNTYGFPDENGVILIDDEIILYRKKVGNYFYDLKRGASGTYILPTFTRTGEYTTTEATKHLAGAKVYNLSVLFMVSMLETIHDSFTPNIHSTRVSSEVTRSVILSKIQDFYKAKGTKLGIKALFKILFAQNDVEVTYPGDRMIVPSKSTWNESELLRVVPVPDTFCDLSQSNVNPGKLINSELLLKSYLDEKVYARMVCDYISSYPYEDEVQYEMFIQKDSIKGKVIANPNTVLTRNLNKDGTIDDRKDVYTITVETTLGFPNSGVVFIDDEAISYTSKTFNQFLGCVRGYIGVAKLHNKGTSVYGPYYIEGKYIEDEEEFISRSWPLGLVETVEVVEPGLLHTIDDEVFVNGPGRIDPREPIMESFIENYDDVLSEQSLSLGELGYVGNYSAGVNGVYFDKKHVFATSSNLPYYSIGRFGTNPEIGKSIQGYNQVHIIPRRESIQPNTMFDHKGTNRIGTFVDGVSAFSNISPEKYYSGKIAKVKVVNQGHNYVNPSLVIGASESPADIIVEDGKIIQVIETDPDNHTTNPNARISSGEGAEISLEFDLYGRVTNAYVISQGKYYKDVPNVSVIDSTSRGKGAVIACTVNPEGGVDSVSIVYSGIDYNPQATTGRVIPIGDDCIIESIVQYYEFDRVYEINSASNLAFDSGNGFVFEDTSKTRTAFGYLGNPTDVLDRKGEDGVNHSPLIGWAYDGNPIYGPNGYTNKKNDEDGISHYYSGYVLRKDRSEIIAGGGDEVGTLPPSTGSYPMGIFVQDYEHNVDKAIIRKYRLNSEVPERIKEEGGKYLNVKDQTIEKEQILDSFNGMVCNTPEFPEEFYPDGVYCYFISVDIDGTMQFPYIIGPSFKDRPISQNIVINDVEQLQPIVMNDKIFDPNMWYDETRLEFDFRLVERFRNPYLSETRDEVKLSIGEISKGGISEVLVEIGKPDTSEVSDLIYFDNKGTMGSGAEAKVSHIVGAEVEAAIGRDLRTVTVSHVQRIDLKYNNPDKKYLFVEGQKVTSSSGAEGNVLKFDYELQLVDIRISTPNLIQEGDLIYDVRGEVVNIGYLKTKHSNAFKAMDLTLHIEAENGLLILDETSFALIEVENPIVPEVGIRNFRNSRIYTQLTEPRTEENQVGDLWWSHRNGRLYVWYQDTDSFQWVCTQPIGIYPIDGASDTGIGTTAPTNQIFDHYSTESTITISRKAPSSRKDNTRNRYGDLWWSSHTGILYIWNDDTYGSFDPADIEGAGEWVCTDPNAKVPTIYASDYHKFYKGTSKIRSFPINSIISNGPPKNVGEGTLWWCPGTAKLYILFDDQWVVANPVAWMPTKYASDILEPGGGGSGGQGPIIPLPELPSYIENGISEFWFRNLKYFVPGDDIRFNVGAPGTGPQEDAILDAVLRWGPPDHARVIRGPEPIELPDGTPTVDLTRSLYIINTKTPHQLKPGDYIKIENSKYDEVNNTHQVVDAGIVEPATGRARVSKGEVVEVIIDSPGKYYTQDFFVYFIGGGGTGAYGYAEVDPLIEGGGVSRVTMLNGGNNFTHSPKIVFGTEISNKVIIIYTSQTYGIDPDITYSTTKEGIQGLVKYVKVTAPGSGYESLPICTGLIKKQSDRAITKIKLNGSTIEDVELMGGGRRYSSPVGIIEDLTGSGSGASVNVEVKSGVVQNIDVISPGSDYVDPIITLVETEGKYISLTKDIGQIKSFRVINPGRNISPDPSLKPELQITTRVVIRHPMGYFVPGQEVYQGIETNKQVVGVVAPFDVTDQVKVISTEDVTEVMVAGNLDLDIDGSGILANQLMMSDPDRQILTLIRVKGNLEVDEMIYSDTGQGMVVLEGQSDSRIVVGGVSSPEGQFIDDTSKVSEKYPVIQDSYYYQWFSYSIQSSLQQVQYKNIIRDIIHPSGFIMFSDVIINDNTKSGSLVQDVVFTNK